MLDITTFIAWTCYLGLICMEFITWRCYKCTYPSAVFNAHALKYFVTVSFVISGTLTFSSGYCCTHCSFGINCFNIPSCLHIDHWSQDSHACCSLRLLTLGLYMHVAHHLQITMLGLSSTCTVQSYPQLAENVPGVCRNASSTVRRTCPQPASRSVGKTLPQGARVPSAVHPHSAVCGEHSRSVRTMDNTSVLSGADNTRSWYYPWCGQLSCCLRLRRVRV